LLESVAATVEEQTHDVPLVICIDDAQWVDDFTAQLLLFLALRAPRLRLLLLLTSRTAEPDATPDWLAHELPNAAHVNVGQLRVEEAADLVRAFEAERGIQLSEAERNRVLWHTAGRPLLLVEMLTAITGGSRYEVVNSGVVLPETTETVLRRRFTGLDHSAVWVYGVVAAIGEPMDVAELVRLAAIDHKQAAESLEVLCERGILELRDGRVAFPHDILREVAYRNLASSTRMLIHRRISDYSLETNGDVGVLATHLVAAGGGAEAAKYAFVAARHAERDGRFGDREYYYRLAMDNADDPMRAEAAIALARHLLEAQRGAEVQALFPLLQTESAGQEGQLLAELARLGERVTQGDLRPDEVASAAASVTDILHRVEASELAPAIETIMDVILDAADATAGDRIVQEILLLTEATHDETLIYHARCVALLWECVTKGYESPLRVADEGLDNPAAFGRRAGFGFFTRGTIFMVAGILEAARTDLEKALALANDSEDQVRASAAAANLGVVLTELGALPAGKKYLEANLTSHNFTHRLRCHANLAILAYEAGEYDYAINTAENLLRANSQYGAAKYRNTANAVIGLSHMSRGNMQGAVKMLPQVLDLGSMTLAASGDLGYIASFAGKSLASLYDDVDGALKLVAKYAVALQGRDAIGHMRLSLARAEILAMSGNAAAYVEAKAILGKCEQLGAVVLGRRATEIMRASRF
ncbi:MAG TPA: hypothetical protein VK929_16120, partial [Longimicrobiales bacterium]|nr:hypothetical protein [Longimicrobiales bacterium]